MCVVGVLSDFAALARKCEVSLLWSNLKLVRQKMTPCFTELASSCKPAHRRLQLMEVRVAGIAV